MRGGIRKASEADADCPVYCEIEERWGGREKRKQEKTRGGRGRKLVIVLKREEGKETRFERRRQK